MTLTNDAAYTYENSDGSAAAYSRTSSSAAVKPSPAKGKTTSAKRQRVNWSPEVRSYLMSSCLTLGTPSFSQPLSSHFLLLLSFFFFPLATTAKEDERLKRMVLANTMPSGRIPWSALAKRIPGKTAKQLHRR